jgi:hypothetical protein
LRICLLASDYQTLSPPSDSGSDLASTYIYKLVQGLCDLGHDLEVVTLASQTLEEAGPASQERRRPVRIDGSESFIGSEAYGHSWERRLPAGTAGALHAPLRDSEAIGSSDAADTSWERGLPAGTADALHAPLRDSEASGSSDAADSSWERRLPAGIEGAHSAPIQQNDPIVYRVDCVNNLPELRMLNLATPVVCKTLKAAFALWKVILERHLEQPFDVIQIPEYLAIGILPAIAKIAPVVVVSEGQPLDPSTSKIKPDRLPNRPSGDQLIIKLLEQLCLSTADGHNTLLGFSLSAPALTNDACNPTAENVAHTTIDLKDPPFDPKSVAKDQICVYQSAIHKHANYQTKSTAYRLYLKDPKELFSQALELAVAFDKMIYDYLYQYSYRFRLAHWQRQAGANPKQFARKALGRIIHPFAHVHPKLAAFSKRSG